MLKRVVANFVTPTRRLGVLASTSWSVTGGGNKVTQGGHKFGRKPAKAHAPFGEVASQQLARVQSCVEVLKEANPSFSCELTASERVDIAIANEHGEARFELTLQTAKEQLQLYSTISGLQHYEFSAATGTWINTEDGHDMEGLLTRDLLRLCVGCPNF